MGKLVVTEFVTLDGIIEAPETWSFAYFDEQISVLKFEELLATGAHLLGRVTYESFAQAWPGRTDEQGFAEKMNSLPKYVVSTTLDNAEWTNSHVIKEGVPERIVTGVFATRGLLIRAITRRFCRLRAQQTHKLLRISLLGKWSW